jgi:dihydroneopterin aldolase
MITVHLQEVFLFAHHGIYEQERENGNTFEISLHVSYEQPAGDLDDISRMVDYEVLFGIIRHQMKTPSPLLEQVCHSVISQVKQYYPQVTKISMSLFKLKAPIAGFEGKAGVTLEQIFDI